jgi:hypothetical protein
VDFRPAPKYFGVDIPRGYALCSPGGNRSKLEEGKNEGVEIEFVEHDIWRLKGCEGTREVAGEF